MAKKKRSFDWLSVVDLDQALANVQTDIYGDWYRDPWAWPELDWCVKREPTLVTERLSADDSLPTAPIDVAKEGFGTRPATILDPLDRLAYQALVDLMSGDLIGPMRPGVFGWRLPRNDFSPGHYSNNGTEHGNFRNHLMRYAGHKAMYGLKTDIVSCYANVELDRLLGMISARSRSSKATERISSLLRGWTGIPSRRGLPQRSLASAVLANLYLTPIDDEIMEPPRTRRRRKGKESVFSFLKDLLNEQSRGTSVGWMDDIWVLKLDESELRETQTVIEQVLRSIGMDINTAKTQIIGGDELWADAARSSFSAVEDGLLSDPANEEPLNELLDRLIGAPEHGSTSAFRFVCRRMRDHQVFDRVEDLAEVAHRAPHAADSLARLFRESGHHREMHRWFLSYWKSNWATTDWAVAQFGTMFPAKRTRKPLRERYASEVATPEASLALTSLAAERLASKDPATFRAAIRASIPASHRPLTRRSLALAAVMCGEEKKFVRDALSEFPSNQLTLKYLEDCGFKPPKVVSDYSGN